MKNFSFFLNLRILLFILLIIYSNNEDIKGIFRIDSVSNGNSLTDENYSLQFSPKKEKSGSNQLFRLVKNFIRR